jgi:hypothetical protein
MLMMLIATIIMAMSLEARTQTLASLGDPTVTPEITTPANLDLTYVRPTARAVEVNYAFDAFGPYRIAVSAATAGIHQFNNSPPEWNQGLKGYSRRFGSDFAASAVGTTVHYGLSQAFREDSLYYRCDCRGTFPRLRYAMISTLTGRRGADGHRVFSFSALAAPYAGSMAAVYGWYPNRFGAKDAFRMGNYGLLTYMGGNIGLEFFYSGRHSLLSRMHLNNPHGATVERPNP